jgi:hypothetical protein
VFDGHGGRTAVDFVSQRLGENVVSAVLAAGTGTHDAAEHDAVSTAIRAAYLATDSELLVQVRTYVTLTAHVHSIPFRDLFTWSTHFPMLNASKSPFVPAIKFWMPMRF